MSLGEKQRIFTHNVALLICHAYALGYQLSFGNTTAPTSLATSLHPKRLAIDLNLFKKDSAGRWRYQTKVEPWRELGEFWERLHPMNVWGGRWESGDANHLEMSGNR